jgi:hypothetical protein
MVLGLWLPCVWMDGQGRAAEGMCDHRIGCPLMSTRKVSLCPNSQSSWAILSLNANRMSSFAGLQALVGDNKQDVYFSSEVHPEKLWPPDQGALLSVRLGPHSPPEAVDHSGKGGVDGQSVGPCHRHPAGSSGGQHLLLHVYGPLCSHLVDEAKRSQCLLSSTEDNQSYSRH